MRGTCLASGRPAPSLQQVQAHTAKPTIHRVHGCSRSRKLQVEAVARVQNELTTSDKLGVVQPGGSLNSNNAGNGASSAIGNGVTSNGKQEMVVSTPTTTSSLYGNGSSSNNNNQTNGGSQSQPADLNNFTTARIPAEVAAFIAASAAIAKQNLVASLDNTRASPGGSPGASSPPSSSSSLSSNNSSNSPSQAATYNDSTSQAYQDEISQLRAALQVAANDKLHAEARAHEAELQAREAHDALVQAQEVSSSLNKQYNALWQELESFRQRHSPGSAAASTASQDELDRQVDDLQAQLEDLDYRLAWALRDLRAHQLVLRAQGELSMHLSGLPSNVQQQIFEQVDSGAELLGDGGSATVHAVILNGEELAVKVMPLYDINTARPYHFRDICTTFLRHQRSPYIEMPLHTFLRLKDDEVEGTQYYLYTVWPRRHMDVDQLLCRRALRPAEILTIMHHSVMALQDLSVARMVHADVKPPNVLVMMGPDGLVSSAHLTDFGSVQFVAPGEEAAPAIWDGQLAWNWPPEQRELVYLESCDVWGLGILYSCMKVCNPTKQEVTDVLQNVNASAAEFDRVRDQELMPDYADDPPELRALTRLMRKCVVRNPHKRPSIQELVVSITELNESMQAKMAGAPAKGGRSNSTR